jgi:hypothetical protein
MDYRQPFLFDCMFFVVMEDQGLISTGFSERGGVGFSQ